MTLIIVCQKYEGKSNHVSRRITTSFSGAPDGDNNIGSTNKDYAKRRFFHETVKTMGELNSWKVRHLFKLSSNKLHSSASDKHQNPIRNIP